MIPCYGRPDDLRRTLQETRRQTFSDLEVVVIDDATPGDAVAAVVREFPECRYVRLPRNLGLIGARNAGAGHCRGDYIINLDDDSWLVDADAVARIVAFLDARPAVAVAALNVRQPGPGLAWPAERAPFPTGIYVGCGNVLRRSALAKVGGYIAEFKRQGEELEHSFRVVDAGFAIMALPGIEVFHNESPLHRNRQRIYTFEAINILRREALRAPAALLPLGAALFVKFLVVNARRLDWSLLIGELARGPHSLGWMVRRYRKPISVASYWRCLRLRRAAARG